MKHRLLYGGLVVSLGLACGSSGSNGKKNPADQGTNLTGPEGNACSAEPWELALVGLVVTEGGELGQDGSGLPETEQTWALLSDLSESSGIEDYAVFRQTRGRQRKLQTLTQFSVGYPQSSVNIAIRNGKPGQVESCQALAELIQGKSLVSRSEETSVYRTFAFKHDFSQAAAAIMAEIPSLRQDNTWNREAPLFKEGVEATAKSFIMDVTYKSSKNPETLENPELVSMLRNPVELVCQKPFRIKAFTLNFTKDERDSMGIAADHCQVSEHAGSRESQECVLLKVEHTADECTFTAQDASIHGTTGKVSLSGRLRSNADISADRKAPFYQVIVDRIGI
jgi:hypothetical protein